MSAVTPRLRFAPSPTGKLHLGSAASAIINFALAEKMHGVCLVRIEDTDITRCHDGFVTSILDDLLWLGLAWPCPALRQSQHFGRYQLALDALRQLQVVYPCFASRSEISAAVAGNPEHPRDPDGVPLYPGLCKELSDTEISDHLASGHQAAWRLDMDRAVALASKLRNGRPIGYNALDGMGNLHAIAAQPERWGDVVVARKDTPTSCHLSVVIDDAYQGITHVVRGTDLKAATDLHCLLQVLLRLPHPIYHHHGLILDDGRRKLSKSAQDKSLAALRSAGQKPADIRRSIAHLLQASGISN